MHILDKISCEIYKAELNGEEIWFSKLVNNLGIDRQIVAKGLSILMELNVVLSGYDYIDDENLITVYIIHDGWIPRFEKLYNEYYKQN